MNSEKSLDKEICLRMPQMCSQNVANAISAIQFLKIFRGSMPPDPPRSLNFTKFPPLVMSSINSLIIANDDNEERVPLPCIFLLYVLLVFI